MSQRIAGLLLGIVILIADQLSKYWVLHGAHLTDGHLMVLAPVLNFVLVWNRGITFGLLTAGSLVGTILLAIFAAAVIAGLLVWLFRTRRLTACLAIGAIAGGAVGNVADRLRFGAVVDFIQAHLDGHYWYVFNIGDAAIVCGVATLMAESLFRTQNATHATPAGQLPPATPEDRKAP